MVRFTKSYINLLAKENNTALLSINKEKINHDCGILTLSTGGIGFPSLDNMLSSFVKNNCENELHELSKFIIDLNIEKIVIYNHSYFSSDAALLIFSLLCNNLGIHYIVCTPKPFSFSGNRLNKIFSETLEIINHIANECYVVDETMMEGDNTELGLIAYQLKFDKMFDKYAYEKFLLSPMKVKKQRDSSVILREDAAAVLSIIKRGHL